MTILRTGDPLQLKSIDEEIERLMQLKKDYEEKRIKYLNVVGIVYPNVKVEELFDSRHSKKRTYVYARYMIFFFLIMVEKISVVYLARLINMHHSTLLWGIESVFNSYDTDIEERDMWNRLIGESEMKALKAEFLKKKRHGKTR